MTKKITDDPSSVLRCLTVQRSEYADPPLHYLWRLVTKLDSGEDLGHVFSDE